jgi:hypothetical protein
MFYSIVRGLTVVLLGFAVIAIQSSVATAESEKEREPPDIINRTASPPAPRSDTRNSVDDVIEHRLGGCPEGPPCPSPSSSTTAPGAPPEPESCGENTPCPKGEPGTSEY